MNITILNGIPEYDMVCDYGTSSPVTKPEFLRDDIIRH